MARPERPVAAGLTYHLTQRGNDRGLIFRDDRDRGRFLSVLGATVTRRGWSCMSYCLMSNHVHLLVHTPEPDLDSGMRDVFSGYARRFNLRHARTGHVFGARYGSVVIETDAQLLATLRDVALNPVEAGVVDHPAKWPWSSYAALCGRIEAPAFLGVTAALALLDDEIDRARRLLRDFVEGPGEKVGITTRAAGPLDRVPIAKILGDESGPDAIRTAIDSGHSQTDIARHLGVSQSTVSRRARTPSVHG